MTDDGYTARVHVTPDSGHDKPWRVDCDLCPDVEPLRFHTRHWAKAHADDHAINGDHTNPTKGQTP